MRELFRGGIFTVKIIFANMPPRPCLRGGIFAVKILTFSSKSAEKIMGVNGFDCPAVFLGPGVLNFLGGGRGCAGVLTTSSTKHLLPKNFEKTALKKRGQYLQ